MRIVVKVGTKVVTGKDGLDRKKVSLLVRQIADVMKKGHEAVLVSSGAIGTGLPHVHFSGPEKKKVAAAVGQPILMGRYIEEAKKRKVTVGQVLILSEDFKDKSRFHNFLRNIESTLSHKVLPIINENDFMKSGDLSIGDNDMFGAVVAKGIRADKYIMLTNQDGLFTCNPDQDKNACLLRTIEKVDKRIENLCGKEKSDLGRGGMLSKIRAAKFAMENGIETFIGRGDKKGMLMKTFEKDFPGTRFLAKKKK